MNMVGFVQGGVKQCCKKIRVMCANVENVRQESMLGDGEDGIDGVWADREVVWFLCKLFLQLNQQRPGK